MNIISRCKYIIDKKMKSEQVMAKEACITQYENEKFEYIIWKSPQNWTLGASNVFGFITLQDEI